MFEDEMSRQPLKFVLEFLNGSISSRLYQESFAIAKFWLFIGKFSNLELFLTNDLPQIFFYYVSSLQVSSLEVFITGIHAQKQPWREGFLRKYLCL